jgi:hypothetical protein
MLAAALLALLALGAVQDPVQVGATLSTARVAPGDAATLTITATARGASSIQIRNPALPAELDVVGTSDFSETRGSIRDGIVRVVRRELVIVPRSAGAYRIPAAVITVAGTSYYTEPLLLRVSGGAPAVGADESGSRTTLVVRLYPDTVFVGQQVVMHAEVTFAEQLRMRQSRPPAFEPPAPSGFWVQDLPDPVTISLRVRDGRSVESQTFRRAYFPLSAGEFTFPPAHLHYEVRRGFLSPPESRRVSSDSARVRVLPLPEQGRPATFTGAVGRLDISAAVAPQRVAVGEAALLTVELTGRGNMRALSQPRLPELRGLEVYAPTQEAQVSVASDVVGGTKQFRWVLVPEAPGTVVIPPIEYSVFDPDLRQYVVIRTDTLRFDALPVVVATGLADTALRALRVAPGQAPAGWARTPAFAALQVVPLLLVGAGVLVRRRRSRPPGPRDHERRLRRQLAVLRASGDVAAPARLERLLLEAVHCVAGLDDVEPVGALRASGHTRAADTLAALLADLRRARYAPAAERGSIAPLFDRADAFIAALAPRRRRWTGFAALLALAAVAPWSAAGENDAFRAGVAAWERGSYQEATDRFREHVRFMPDDPNGWYNFGLAAHRAGDPGRGTWAWLRGLAVAPRDADLRHNLELTATPEAVARAIPLDRLAPGERLVVAAVAWWVLVLAAGFGSVTGRGLMTALTLPAGVVLLATALAAAALRVGPVWVTPMGAGAELLAGPSVREQPVARLQPGHVARLLERRDEWLLVRSGDGRDGWVEHTATGRL